jgi:hypothetical protein
MRKIVQLTKADVKEKHSNKPIIALVRRENTRSGYVFRINQKAMEVMELSNEKSNPSLLRLEIGKDNETGEQLSIISKTTEKTYKALNPKTALENKFKSVAVRGNNTFQSADLYKLMCNFHKLTDLKVVGEEDEYLCELEKVTDTLFIMNKFVEAEEVSEETTEQA